MNEATFRGLYAAIAARQGLDPDPYNPLHFYDYRAALEAGARPNAAGHWPSIYKRLGHPNLFIGGIDTRTGMRANWREVLAGENIRTRAYKAALTMAALGGGR